MRKKKKKFLKQVERAPITRQTCIACIYYKKNMCCKSAQQKKTCRALNKFC